MNRLPAPPHISLGLSIAEKRLGLEELSRRLDASETTIRAWQSGDVSMPEHKFLQLVDVLLAIDRRWLDDNI